METNYHDIKYKDNTVKLLQYLSESNSQFNKRVEFIKKLEKKDIDWKEANRLSRIWFAIKFKKCKYPQEVYYKIINLDK
jgi:hypothetical protein